MRTLLLHTPGGNSSFAYSPDFCEISVVKTVPEKDFFDTVSDFVRSLKEPLEIVGVTKGPGRFSAIRQGGAYGQGLALGLQIPILGCSTIDAFVPSQEGVFAVTVPLSKREAFVAVRELKKNKVVCLSDPQVMSVKDIFEFCEKRQVKQIFCSIEGFFSSIPENILMGSSKPNFHRLLGILRSNYEKRGHGDSLELDYVRSVAF